MAEKKQQHYLPQFYLKGFSTKRKFNGVQSENVWSYDKLTHTIKNKSVKNTAYENYLYSFLNKDSKDHILEDIFSKIENNTKTIFDKIISISNGNSSKSLSFSDKSELIDYSILCHLRSPTTLSVVKNKFLEIVGDDEFTRDEYQIKNLILYTLFSDRNNDLKDKLKNQLFNKNMVFVFTKKSQFITTENQFSKLRKYPIDDIKSEVYLPIRYNILLVFSGHGNDVSFEHYTDRNMIRKVNIEMAETASKLLVAKDEAYLRRILKETKLPIQN